MAPAIVGSAGADKQCSHQVRRHRLELGPRAVWDSHGYRHPVPASTGAHRRAPTSTQTAGSPAGTQASACPPPAAFGTAAPACDAASTPTTSEYAEKRRFIRGHCDIGRVENRKVIKCGKESGRCITHVVTHTAGTIAETISGTRDVADQPMLVAAGNDHAGGQAGRNRRDSWTPR